MKKFGKRLNVLLASALLSTSLLAGCGKQEDKETQANAKTTTAASNTPAAGTTAADAQQTEAATQEQKELEPLAVSYPAGNIRVTVNILALQKGYFTEQGITVNPIAVAGNDALTAINEENGALDILTAGFVPDVQASGAGYELSFIAGTAVEGGSVIAKKGNADKFKGSDKILNLEEVTKAKLGFARNEASWVVTRQYLLDNGISNDVIKSIENEDSGNVSYYADATATAQAVQKGEVELGFLPMEFALLYADAYDLEIVAAAGDLSPDYVCCREVTSKKRLEDKYDSYVAYEKARIKAFEYYKKGETDDPVKADFALFGLGIASQEAR